MSLLLLADPSEKLVRDYTQSGRTFGATNGAAIIGVFVLLPLSEAEWELKNIALDEAHQGKGYGQYLLKQSIEIVRHAGAKSLVVGTASSGVRQISFYERTGFIRYKLDKGFFIRNYDTAVDDNGVPCVDMLYLKMAL